MTGRLQAWNHFVSIPFAKFPCSKSDRKIAKYVKHMYRYINIDIGRKRNH